MLLSVNQVGQRTTEHRAAPRQTISKRSNVAGVPPGYRRGRAGKSCHTATWVGKKSASDLRGATCCAISWKRWRSTLELSMSAHQRRLEPSALQRRGGAVDLTHGRGVCGSGDCSHSHPAPVSVRCGQARPLGTGPLRLLRTTPVTCGITILSITGVIRISLVLGAQRENAGREAGSGPCRQAPPVAGASAPPCTSLWY
jgi:hypothetical protein